MSWQQSASSAENDQVPSSSSSSSSYVAVIVDAASEKEGSRKRFEGGSDGSSGESSDFDRSSGSVDPSLIGENGGFKCSSAGEDLVKCSIPGDDTFKRRFSSVGDFNRIFGGDDTSSKCNLVGDHAFNQIFSSIDDCKRFLSINGEDNRRIFSVDGGSEFLRGLNRSPFANYPLVVDNSAELKNESPEDKSRHDKDGCSDKASFNNQSPPLQVGDSTNDNAPKQPRRRRPYAYNPKPIVNRRPSKRRQKTTTSHDDKSDTVLTDPTSSAGTAKSRRQSNNESSKRSRHNRRRMEIEALEQVRSLKGEVEELTAEVEKYEQRAAYLEALLVRQEGHL